MIGSGEVRAHAMEVDVDADHDPGTVALDHLDAAAPRQECGVVLDRLDQREHLLAAVRDEHGLVDVGHCYNE